MQTFLPYPNLQQSASVLDRFRLGKQRVETLQIMTALLSNIQPESRWRNHPAVLMWRGHEPALLFYQRAVVKEWTSRGYKDTCLTKTADVLERWAPHLFSEPLDAPLRELIRNRYASIPWSERQPLRPPWYGSDDFHAAHRSNLLRKDQTHYRQFGWTEPLDLEYVWPVRRVDNVVKS